QVAPGGRIDPLGASGVYDCSVGPAPGETAFRVAAFEDELYRIELSLPDGGSVGVAKYPWQLATATLYRERVGAQGAAKFRRLTGSLRLLQELKPGQRIAADYAEAPLDGSSPPLEWRYEITVGAPAASFGPSGMGEIPVTPVDESRRRYVDGQNAPLPLAEATSGFEILETARIVYAPDLGAPLRIERMRDGKMIEACSLAAFRKP
ncbi:MAG: hypothetical protein RIM80_23890, partial [Alphaproteobacteria bacterium]